MYQSHFGLREPPFGLTPDTSFAYTCASHQKALSTLFIAVKNGEGFIKITGEVGTGKTLLCRKFLSMLGDSYVTAYIPNPYLEPCTLLLALAEELHVELGAKDDQHHVLRYLTEALLGFASADKSVVVCLDEAQAMPVETLEALRLLTNLETEKRKLLQVVLFGQPELDEKLAAPLVRQLRQRITFHSHLMPLGADELDGYLSHRLRAAGHAGNRVFTGAAVRALHRASGGIPRRVNVIAHKALMLAFGEGLQYVAPDHVRAAAADTPHMGVINQMLEELEERGASERAVLPYEIRSAPHVAKVRTVRSLGIACGLILSLALVWHFGSQKRAAPSPDRLTELSAALPAVAPPELYALPPEAHAPAADFPIEATPILTTRVEPRAPPIAAPIAPRAGVRLEAKANSSSNAVTEVLPREVMITAAEREEPQAAPAATPAEKIPDTPDISAAPRTPAAQIAATAIEVPAKPAPARPQPNSSSQQTASRELAEREYRGAMNLLSSGMTTEAHERFRLALQHYPAHVGARQALFAQLLDARKPDEAAQVLYDALKADPDQPGFAMALARLQLDRGDNAGAVETLQRSAVAAQENPDYIGVIASLLQRQARHQDAIEHYRAALRLAPHSGVWLMGLGVSLQALRRADEAQDAYRRAKATNSLNPQLQVFVDERLKQLR